MLTHPYFLDIEVERRQSELLRAARQRTWRVERRAAAGSYQQSPLRWVADLIVSVVWAAL